MNTGNPDQEEPLIYALRLHERAVREINAAFVRLGELVSIDAADQWREGLRKAIASLATFPRRCPLAPERFRREVRQLLYRRPGSQTAYRILFTIKDEHAPSLDAPTVTILHVRHASTRAIPRARLREIEADE